MITEYIKKCERRSILSSAIMILIAILLIVKPTEAVSTVMTVFGICLLIDGAFSVILYIAMEKQQKMFSNALVEGMVEIMIALVILMNSGFMLSFITVIVGFWIIIKSIMKVQFAVDMKSVDEKSWVLVFIGALITLSVGIFILVEPIASVATVTVASGIVLLIAGVIEAIESIGVLIKLK